MLRILSLVDKRHFSILSLSVLLVIASTAIQLYLPTGLQRILDEALSERSASSITTIAQMLVAVFALRAIVVSVGQFLLTSTGDRVITDIRNHVFSHIHHLSFQEVKSVPSGDIMSRINNDISAIRSVVTSVLTSVVVNTILFLGTCIIIFSINWKLSLLVLALSPANSILAVFVGKYVYHISKEIQSRLASSNNILNESLHNVETVKTFGLERKQERSYFSSMRSFLTEAIKARKIDAYFSGATSYITSLTKIGLIWVGGLQVIDGAITPGTLVAFLLYSQFISQSVSALAGSYTSVKQAQGASERVFELLDKPKEYLGSEKGESIHDFESLEFKNVSFRHNESQEVFSNISFKIFKGEKVALIGPSGSGKTTLIRLMQGLFSPNEGDVVINGKTAESFNDCARRALFATVPQNVSLFRASIIDNLRLENEKLTDDEIIDACKLSNCHEFIRSLENGYQTIVGENGDTLSGGQKQRLAIARALLRGAPVIVLDEATSNLDNDNALRITELIESLPADKTVVIISHTCKSVDACDRSINISDLKGYQPEPYNSEKLPMLA